MERENREKIPLPHSLTLQDRKKLTASGVSDVLHFDENQIVAATTEGRLVIHGSGLHVDQLDLDSGELRLSGTVDRLEYDESITRGNLLQRLFR